MMTWKHVWIAWVFHIVTAFCTKQWYVWRHQPLPLFWLPLSIEFFDWFPPFSPFCLFFWLWVSSIAYHYEPFVYDPLKRYTR